MGDGPLGGHAEGLLVASAGLVGAHLSGRLVGAREPGADHHVGGAGGEREGDVARVAHAAVGPDAAAQAAGLGRALEHGGELGAADAGHHAGGAHGARAHADLDDVGAGLDQLAGALGGDDVARGQAHGRPLAGAELGPCGADRLDHLVLVAVGGVQHDHVRADVDEAADPAGDVGVDPDGDGDAQAALGVGGGAVDGRAEHAGGGEHSAQRTLRVHDHGGVVVGRGDAGVQARGLDLEVLGGQDRHVGAELVADLGEGVPTGDLLGGDGAEGAAVLVDHDHDAVGTLGQQVRGLAEGAVDGQGERVVHEQVPGLHGADDRVDALGGEVLREDGEAAAARHDFCHATSCDSGHVRGDQRDRGAGAVVAAEVDVEAGGDRGTTGQEEAVVVGQVGRRGMDQAHGHHATYGARARSRAVPGSGPPRGPHSDLCVLSRAYP